MRWYAFMWTKKEKKDVDDVLYLCVYCKDSIIRKLLKPLNYWGGDWMAMETILIYYAQGGLESIEMPAFSDWT